MNIKISEFETLTSTLSGDSVIPIVQNGVNYITDIYTILSIPTQYINNADYAYTLSLSNIGYLLRKSFIGDHIVYVPANVFDAGSVLSIRNVGSGNMLILPENIAVTLNYNTTLSSNIVDDNYTAQIYHVNNNEWDVL